MQPTEPSREDEPIADRTRRSPEQAADAPPIPPDARKDELTVEQIPTSRTPEGARSRPSALRAGTIVLIVIAAVGVSLALGLTGDLAVEMPDEPEEPFPEDVTPRD